MEKETQMTMSENKKIFIFIPDDILIEILSRLPVKSLLRLRWACKYWFDLITRDTNFVKMHLHRHYSTTTATTDDYQNINNTSLLLISGTPSHVLYSMNCSDFDYNSSPPKTVQFDYCNLPAWIDDHTIRAEEEKDHHIFLQSGGSCNGLIFLYSYCGTCFYHFVEYEYFLWNPSTRELKKLPHTKSNEDLHHRHRNSTFFGFGYDHTIDDYKVIDMVCYGGDDDDDVVYQEVIINIYTLGSNSWSTKINTHRSGLGNSALNIFCRINKGCFLNGALHWITKSAIISMSLDTVEEEHRQLQPPNYGDKGLPIFVSNLEVLNGCLCVVNHMGLDESIVELWMMKDYGVNESWTKLFTIDSRKSSNICGSWYLNDLKPIELCKDGGIVMVFNERCLVLYDLKSEKHRWVHEIDHIKYAYVKESYIESLVSLKSGIYLTAAGSTTTTTTTTTTTVQKQQGRRKNRPGSERRRRIKEKKTVKDQILPSPIIQNRNHHVHPPPILSFVIFIYPFIAILLLHICGMPCYHINRGY